MANRRKPNRLKVLEGTDRPDRMYDEPDLPVAKDASAPDWLVGPEAQKEWDRLVGLLEPVRVLTEGDLTLLGHLCNLHAACIQKYRAGMEPTAAQLTQLRLMLTEFGLTPASRSKASQVDKSKSENPFSKLDSA